MKPTKLFAGLVPVIAAASLSVSGLALSHGEPAQAATTAAPRITGITTATGDGGLTPYLSPSCFVAVTFTDDSPSAPSAYSVTATDSYGGTVDTFTGATQGDTAQAFRLAIPCDSVYQDEALTYVVNEGEDVSDSAPFTFSYVGHPAGIEDSSVLRNGEWTHFVGKRATIAFTGGSWEAGTKFSTRIWTSATKTFTPQDFAGNTSGNAAIVDRNGASAPVLAWTPRAQDAGKYVWISIRGEKDGKGVYQFYFNPEKVAPLPTQPVSWVSKWGKIKGKVHGKVKAGHRLTVTKPVLSSAAKAHKASVRYQWSYGTATVIRGATKPTFTPTKKLNGQKLKVTVTVRADGYKDRFKVYKVGVVR